MQAAHTLVDNIVELEALEAPGFGFWHGFGVGTAFGAAIVAGLTIT
jgi:hypothetical protein